MRSALAFEVSSPTPVEAEERVEQLASFGVELDALKKRIEGEVGASDVRHLRRLDRFSRGCEIVGRLLIHFSIEPIGFTAGVVSLWLHKQLQATEVGHTVLHGAYDGLDVPERYRSKNHRWQTPIDEEGWRYGHNGKHHGATNVAGKDGDIHFGPVRLTPQTPHRPRHRFQLLFTLFVLFPNFGALMNLHFSGVLDVHHENGLPTKLDFLKDRSKASRRLAYRRGFGKLGRYYFVEYVLFPALAGPLFWKVLLGNWMAEVMRDVYSAATIFCGHVGEHIRSYEIGTKPKNRGQWYAMQIEATNNYEVSLPVSILCGGLDRQIEHHLFPKLPPQRLRQVSGEVRQLCEKYGVAYHTASWGRTLVDALKWIDVLSRPTPAGRKEGASVEELVVEPDAVFEGAA